MLLYTYYIIFIDYIMEATMNNKDNITATQTTDSDLQKDATRVILVQDDAPKISRRVQKRLKKAEAKLAREQKKAEKKEARLTKKGKQQCACDSGQSTDTIGVAPTPYEDECKLCQTQEIAPEREIEAEELPKELDLAQDTKETEIEEEETIAEEVKEIAVEDAKIEEEKSEALKDAPTKKHFTDMTGKFARFEIYLDKGSKYRFNMIASNGQIVGHSQGYKSKAGCKTGINSVIKQVEDAEVVDTIKSDYSPAIGKAVFEVYISTDNKFRFRLRAANFRPILASQGYTTKANCLKGIASVINIAKIGNIADIS